MSSITPAKPTGRGQGGLKRQRPPSSSADNRVVQSSLQPYVNTSQTAIESQRPCSQDSVLPTPTNNSIPLFQVPPSALQKCLGEKTENCLTEEKMITETRQIVYNCIKQKQLTDEKFAQNANTTISELLKKLSEILNNFNQQLEILISDDCLKASNIDESAKKLEFINRIYSTKYENLKSQFDLASKLLEFQRKHQVDFDALISAILLNSEKSREFYRQEINDLKEMDMHKLEYELKVRNQQILESGKVFEQMVAIYDLHLKMIGMEQNFEKEESIERNKHDKEIAEINAQIKKVEENCKEELSKIMSKEKIAGIDAEVKKFIAALNADPEKVGHTSRASRLTCIIA